jgi:hypothetical protein
MVVKQFSGLLTLKREKNIFNMAQDSDTKVFILMRESQKKIKKHYKTLKIKKIINLFMNTLKNFI